jgi:hypothetical protein
VEFNCGDAIYTRRSGQDTSSGEVRQQEASEQSGFGGSAKTTRGFKRYAKRGWFLRMVLDRGLLVFWIDFCRFWKGIDYSLIYGSFFFQKFLLV